MQIILKDEEKCGLGLFICNINQIVNQKTSIMKKIVLTFGLIAGIIIVAMFFITDPFANDMEMSNAQLVGYATMVIALSTIFFGIKVYRDKHLAGEIKFGKAFLLGILITLVAGVIYSAGWELYVSTTGLDMQKFYNDYAAAGIEKMKEAGASAQEIKEATASNDQMMSAMQNPIIRFLFTMFMELFPVGLVISLISAAILKNKNILPAKAVA